MNNSDSRAHIELSAAPGAHTRRRSNADLAAAAEEANRDTTRESRRRRAQVQDRHSSGAEPRPRAGDPDLHQVLLLHTPRFNGFIALRLRSWPRARPRGKRSGE